MQDLARVSFALLILLAHGGTASPQAYGKERSTDFHVFEWCLSHFPREEGESIQVLPRPAGELRPFDLSNAAAPAGLITQTQIAGKLPPHVEKYQGYWTWPSIDRPSPGAIFVERLTPAEMTIVLIRERGKSDDNKPERMTLSWTGSYFSYSNDTSKESRQMEIRVSQSGDVMAAMSGITRTTTLIDKDGRESSFTNSEGWPLCFLSDTYYGKP